MNTKYSYGGEVLGLSQTTMKLKPIFVGNAFWFLGLAVLSVLLVIFTLWRKRDLKLAALYLALGSIASYLEDVIYICFQSYEYYPQLLAVPYYDMTLGAYLSQVYYVSSVALFIAAFNLGFIWIFFFTIMFVGIEYLFLALKLYKLNWWSPAYTFFGLLIYFQIAKLWLPAIRKAQSRFIRFFTLSGINYILFGNLIAFSIFSNHYHFSAGFFDDPARDTLAVILIFMLSRAFIIALTCVLRHNWAVMVSILLFTWSTYFVLIRMNILAFHSKLDLLSLAASDVVVPLICIYFNRKLSRSGGLTEFIKR
jgi:hypothetical protein